MDFLNQFVFIMYSSSANLDGTCVGSLFNSMNEKLVENESGPSGTFMFSEFQPQLSWRFKKKKKSQF